MSSGLETNMKFIICVILLVHMVLLIYRALECDSSPSETMMTPLLMLQMMGRFLGRLIKSSYIFSGFTLFKMLEEGRKKKMDMFIWGFSSSSKKF